MAVGTAEKMWSTINDNLSSEDMITYNANVRESWSVAHDASDLDSASARDAIKLASGVPKIGDAVDPSLSQIRCVSKDHEVVGPTLSYIHCNFRGEFGPAGATDSPMNMRPKYEWTNVNSKEAVDEDIYGRPLVNAAGDRVHGLSEDAIDWVCEIEKNFLTVNLPAIHQFLRSVNSDPFRTNAGLWAAGLARLRKFKPVEVFDKNVIGGGYFKVYATIMFRYPYRVPAAQAWWKRWRNEGWRYLTADGRKVNVLDDNDDKTNEPVLLKPNGQREPNPNNANWRVGETVYRLPYNTLRFF